MFSFIFIISYYFYFCLLFIVGKEIGRIHKHGQYQLSTLSIKSPVLLSLAAQKSSYIELTITSVPSVRDKKQINSDFCSKNYIQNDLSITNNDNMQSCETQGKQNCIIPTTSTPNHREQIFATT